MTSGVLALIGTVWLFTTPALGPALRHDRIGFVGCTPVAATELASDVVAAIVGDDATVASPAVAVEWTEPGDNKAIVVETPLYCEVFVIRHQGRRRMHGYAVFFDATCGDLWIAHRYRWHARLLYR